MINIGGCPSGTNNTGKILEYNDLLKSSQITVILESGCTKKEPLINKETHKIIVSNPAEKKENDHYIHNGKGTAIIGYTHIST